MLMLASFVRQIDRVYNESTRNQCLYCLRCAKWVRNVRRADLDGKGPADLKHLKLCGLHFDDSQFKNAQARYIGFYVLLAECRRNL